MATLHFRYSVDGTKHENIIDLSTYIQSEGTKRANFPQFQTSLIGFSLLKISKKLDR